MPRSLFLATLCVALPAVAQPVRGARSGGHRDPCAQTVDDTLATVTVITRADIERSQAPDLLTLLRSVPGVDLSRTGGEGQQTSVFLRGSNSNQVLVLIDGVRVARQTPAASPSNTCRWARSSGSRSCAGRARAGTARMRSAA